MAKTTAKRGLDAKLARMQAAWQEQKDEPPGVPDGQYLLQLLSCEVREAASSGKLLTRWEHLVLEGDHEGTVLRDMISLEMDGGPYRVARRLQRLGADPPEELEDLPEVLSQLQEANPILRGTTRKSGDFLNVTVQELVDAEPGSVGTPKAKAAGAGTEEPPFVVGEAVAFTAVEDEDPIEVVITAIDLKEGTATLEDDEHIYEGIALENLELVPEATAEATPEQDEDEELAPLLEFCEAVDLQDELPDEDSRTVESVVEVLREFEFNAADLTPEEVELLESHGLEVNKPKPKATARKKVTKKAVAKKVTKKKGKPRTGSRSK